MLICNLFLNCVITEMLNFLLTKYHLDCSQVVEYDTWAHRIPIQKASFNIDICKIDWVWMHCIWVIILNAWIIKNMSADSLLCINFKAVLYLVLNFALSLRIHSTNRRKCFREFLCNIRTIRKKVQEKI